MKKVSEFYFKHNSEKYYKLRDGVEAVFPGLTETDKDVRRWLADIDALEHRIKHHIMDEYCEPEE